MPIALDVADNGKIALEKVKQSEYDLVIMDIRMPIIDGIEATVNVRNWEKENNRKKTPIVILTAYSLQQMKNREFQIDYDDFLLKPFQKIDFLKCLLKNAR